MVGFVREVIRRVFVGGEGWVRGGMLEREIERGVCERVEVGESGGEVCVVAIVEVVRGCVWFFGVLWSQVIGKVEARVCRLFFFVGL